MSISKLSRRQRLSLGLIVLGIGFMGWSLYHIADSFLSLRGMNTNFKTNHATKLSSVPFTPFVSTEKLLANLPNFKQTSDKLTGSPFIQQNKAAGSVNSTVDSHHYAQQSTSLEILYPIRPSDGDTIGTLTFPKLGQKLPIIQGADPEELKVGVGHFSQSVLPGENNNSVLSGHRDTVFRQVGQLKIGDSIVVETSAGQFNYEIKNTRIVHEDDKTVIVPTNHAVLTVTTCYPFNYIGDAPDRYIITSELVKNSKG